MNNFWKRAITGSIFVAVLVFCAISSQILLAILFLFFTAVGTYEYFNIVDHKKNTSVNRFGGYVLSIGSYLVVAGTSYFDLPKAYLVALIPVITIIFIIELFRLKENSFANILHTIMPTLYVAVPFGLFIVSNELIQISAHDYSAELILMFFFTLWANDTGAYLSGRSFGKRKLFPKISPNKTWEGTIGGAILAVLVAYNCGAYFISFSRIEWVIMALIIVVFGSLGDLVESMLKRSYDIKDSGKILPGHGGILDRFDGLLIAAPVVFSYIVFIRLL
ncbi:MAG: phosphatidate cytidylyltransferase [Saprospiraceae bacterium]|jgi:phosphatidate cytidylyltransferase